MFGLGPLELMVIGVIAVMLYGKQLPDVGLKVGKSLSELRRQWSNISRDLDVTGEIKGQNGQAYNCLLYTSPSPRDLSTSRMPSSA